MRLPPAAALVALAYSQNAAADPVELLHHVPSDVQVSSAVESKTIEPKQLVDGDRNTAWNSTAGELVGAWIEVTVPPQVTVDEIKLIVGHTGKGKEGDYFPMNHRIKKVRVLRAGKSLGDFVLDPNNRELQSIKIGAPGGTFRVQVLATTPGTKRSWREIAVAELEVWGTLPPGMTARRHDVGVRLPTDIRVSWQKQPALVRAYGKPTTFDDVCKRTNCIAASMKKLAPKDGAFKTLAVEPGINRGYSRIYIETAAGWWYIGGTDIGAYSDATYSAVVEQLEIKDGFALITIDHRAPSGGDHARLFQLCTVAPDNTPACLNNNIPVEVVHTKYDVHTQHRVSVGSGYLSIDRGTMKAWEHLVGDHTLQP
ncbi:MAG: hypothetical protein JNL83_36710 [Myxococcales bacterium]|nr:hypothetical protein [Myxococcales bacterium]